MKFIDLCCGIGGFHMALKRIHKKSKVVFASDIDKKCREVYEKNHTFKVNGDFTKVDVKEIPSFEGLTAGFPCQPFSFAGNRLGLEDTRGTLIYDIIKIIKHHCPKWVCLENVKGIQSCTSANGQSVLDIIFDVIDDLGYTHYHRVLSPHELNIPQHRERLIMVFIRNDCLKSSITDFTKEIKEYVNKLIRERKKVNKGYNIHDSTEDLTKYHVNEQQKKVLEMWDDFVSRPEWDSISNTQLQEIYKTHTGKKTKKNFKQAHFFTDFLNYKKDNVVKGRLKGKTRKDTISKGFKETSDVWNILYEHHPTLRKMIDSFLKKYDTFIQTLPLLYRYLEYSSGQDYSSETSLNEMYAQFRPSGLRIRKKGIFPTLVKSGPRPIIISQKRYISNHEMARLQSFDIPFTFKDDKSAMSQCGNAVNVEVIEVMLRGMFHMMK